MKRSLISTLIATLFVLPGATFAQEADAQEQGLPKLVESVEVRVINVDVVVTDRRGNVVKGLTADDFEVYENGRKQPISNFYEVSSEELEERLASLDSPAEQREAIPANLRRRVVFFIDNLTMAPFNRNRVFESMKEFARDVLRPGDEAMVVTWNRSLKIRVPFTSDAQQIQQALDTIAGETAFGLQNLSERRSFEGRIRDARDFNDAVLIARQYAQSVEHDLRTTTATLNGLMSTLAGIEGKKIMVLSSEGIHIQPGREMFEYIEEVKRERSDWMGAPSTMIEAMHFNSTYQIQSVARTANANGITLYTMHAGGLQGHNDMSAENRTPISANVSQAALTNSTDALNMLADLTGGRATVGTNNFGGAFDKIEQDLSNYYSIGYRATTERVDRQRNLEVKMKNREYVARARKTFVEKSMETEMTDKVIANLLYPQSTNDLEVVVRTGRPEAGANELFRVPLEVMIPLENLTLLPQGEVHMGGFTVFIVVGDINDDMSDVSRQTQRIQISPEELEGMAGKHFTYAVELLMRGGRNRISVGVVDDVTNTTGFARTEILAADLR